MLQLIARGSIALAECEASKGLIKTIHLSDAEPFSVHGLLHH